MADNLTYRTPSLSPLTLHGGPLIIFVVLSFAIWQIDQFVVRNQLKLHIGESEVLAEQSSRHLKDYFASRFQIVSHLAGEWETQLSARPQAFKLEAENLQDLFTGFQAVNWVDRDGVIRWVTPERTNRGLIGKNVLSVQSAAPVFMRAKETNIPHVTPPVDLLQGFVGIVGYFPVRRGGHFDGAITAVFNTTEIVRDVIETSFRDNYIFTILNGDKVVFQSKEQVEKVPFSVTKRFSIWDQNWTMNLTPVDAAKRVQGLSPLILAAFMVLAVFLTGLFWLYLKRLRDLMLANNAKSEFLANMSHDLRTPLNAIMGFSDMMRSKAFGPLGNAHYDQYAEDIHHSGTLLVSLINDVLDISKIESGKYELADESLDVSALIHDSYQQLRFMAKASNQSLVCEIKPNFPALRGDERALLQILNNTISNAIKFSPDGATVRAVVDLDHSQKINIRIIDTGIGMTKEGIAKALRPFEQADGLHSRRHEGTGLGLHLSSNLMKLFGGTLNIESAPGQGTTVHLQFPASRTIFA